MDRTASLINYVKQGQLEPLRKVLDENPGDIRTKHSTGKSLLMLAAYYKQTDVIGELRNRGLEPDIYEAAALGDLESVTRHIAGRPSSIFTRHEDGSSLLGLATYFGHVEIVKLLLKNKADPNQSSITKATVLPLHSAIARDDIECCVRLVTVLLAGGANPNLAQSKNRTALHLAVKRNRVEIVRLLLDYGGDIWAKDTDDFTPEELAHSCGHDEIGKIFEENRIARETEAFIDTQLLAAMESGEFGTQS